MQMPFDLPGATPLAEARLLSRERERRDPADGDDAALRASIARLERARAAWGAAPFGDARVDACLPLGGLPFGHWHEIGGDGREAETPAAVTGFAAALAQRAARGGAIVWALRRDDLYAPGLAAFGLDADRLIVVRVDKDSEALSVQEDALRTRGIAAAIGEVETIDLIAGRRLQLACEKHGATGFVLRRKVFGTRPREGRAAAAATRWRIAPAPSVCDEPGLGPPRWTARLERCRGGRTGAWIMEMQDADAAAPAAGVIRVVAQLADHALATDHGRAEPRWARHYGDGGECAAAGGG